MFLCSRISRTFLCCHLQGTPKRIKKEFVLPFSKKRIYIAGFKNNYRSVLGSLKPYMLLSQMGHYTLPPTPPYAYHPVRPPPYQFYTSSQTPYIFTTPTLISDATKGFLHQLNSKVTRLDAKLAEISILIEVKKRVAHLPNLVQVNVFEGSSEVCEGTT